MRLRCEDCIHQKVCEFFENVVDITTDECKLFEDETQYTKILIPLEIGDTVYTFDDNKNIEEYIVKSYKVEQGLGKLNIEITADKSFCFRDVKRKGFIRFTPDEIGKTVFLLKEQLERLIRIYQGRRMNNVG